MKTKKSIAVVLNAKAADDMTVHNAFGQLRRRGHRLEVHVTEQAGDGARFAAESARAGIDMGIPGLSSASTGDR